MPKPSFFLPLLLVACNSTPQVEDGNAITQSSGLAIHQEAQELIFFAVIEGLYHDGVDTVTASAIAEIEEPAGLPHNFVYGCPICTPALDAVRLYVSRPGFYRDKQGRDTFGSGLDPQLRERLLAADRKARRTALQGLIEKWVEKKIATSGFDNEKREDLRIALLEMRKKGMGLLYQFQSKEGPEEFLDFYRDWKACPSCDGANEAES